VGESPVAFFFIDSNESPSLLMMLNLCCLWTHF